MATATARRPAKAAAKTNSKPAASVKGGKIIYFFGKSRCDGKGDMKALLGGKGANLAAMTRIGLPVPPGFTITTEVCTYYYQNGKRFPPNQASELAKA
ncbi:MAG TPA: PEP/pyruvate-binding domain-containing protein, partial [Pirellulaceae bacterium]|nr:PEP/pyruvate-binding domain-containing protein [Pirellulaceae bacterium]